MAILAALGWLWNKLDDVIPKTWQQNAFDQLAHLAVLVLVVFGILFLAVAVLISYLNLLQRYYHFTLTKQAHTLTATRGFFKRLEVSVRISRIQAVRMRQSLLRHWLHLTTIQALLASNAADEEKDNDLVLLPVIKADQALTRMHHFVDWVPATTPTSFVCREQIIGIMCATGCYGICYSSRSSVSLLGIFGRSGCFGQWFYPRYGS